MVKIQNHNDSTKRKLVIEVLTTTPSEELQNLKSSIIECLCDTLTNENETSGHAYYLTRFLKELEPELDVLKSGFGEG